MSDEISLDIIENIGKVNAVGVANVIDAHRATVYEGC